MTKGMEKLQALLTRDGRELVNIKFFPGTGRGLTSDQLAEAAAELLDVDVANIVENPPLTGLDKASL